MVILRGEWQQGREGAAVVQAREGLLHKQPVSVWVELLLVKITVHSMANLSVRCGRQQHTQMRDKAGERVGWESDGWLRGAGTASEAKKSVIYLGISGQSQTLQHSERGTGRRATGTGHQDERQGGGGPAWSPRLSCLPLSLGSFSFTSFL